MANSLIPNDINKGMVLLAEYLRGGTLTNGITIDADIRNMVLGEWLSNCFPTKSDWELFCDAIADGSIDHQSPYKQVDHINPLSITEKVFLDRFGYTTAKCSQLNEGDLIQLGYKGEDVMALVLATAKTSRGFFLYFTVRGVLKNSRIYKQIKEPFNGAFEGVFDDFKVKLYKKKAIPTKFRGLGNISMPKAKQKQKPTKGIGKLGSDMADYLMENTVTGGIIKDLIR